MRLALVALLLTAPRAGRLPPEAGAEVAIRAVYRAFDEAFEKRDADALEPLFAEDYVATFADGSTNGRDETLADIREEAATAIPPIHCKEQLKRVTLEGDGATVQVAEETGYQVRGADGRLHAYRYTESYEDHLSKVSGRWVLSATRYDVGGEEQLDGKRIERGSLKKLLAAADGNVEREAPIRELYRRAATAFEQKDAVALRSIYAGEWTVITEADATAPGAALVSLTHEARAALPPLHRSFEVRKITFDDDGAVVELSCDTSYGVKGADEKVHALRYIQPTEDRVTLLGSETAAGWRIGSSRLIEGGTATWDGAVMSREEISRRLGR
jgi:ketosteroid isomerase-like protein